MFDRDYLGFRPLSCNKIFNIVGLEIAWTPCISIKINPIHMTSTLLCLISFFLLKGGFLKKFCFVFILFYFPCCISSQREGLLNSQYSNSLYGFTISFNFLFFCFMHSLLIYILGMKFWFGFGVSGMDKCVILCRNLDLTLWRSVRVLQAN